MTVFATDGGGAVHVSKMSGKLSGIPAINTNTLTNPFCIEMHDNDTGDVVCEECYSVAMLQGVRKNAEPAFERNSIKLSSRLLFDDEIPVYNHAWFRLHGHGELINDIHFINFIHIAERNPQTNFALWTKRKKIVYDVLSQGYVIPGNLIMVYSNPRTDRTILTPPDHFDKVFNVVRPDYEGMANCTGQKCIDCLLCYEHNDTSLIIEHIKHGNGRVKKCTG